MVGIWDTEHRRAVDDAVSCVYFSLVTWTTLGYSDLIPKGPARLVAGLEAFSGYLVMAGLIVALSKQFETSNGK